MAEQHGSESFLMQCIKEKNMLESFLHWKQWYEKENIKPPLFSSCNQGKLLEIMILASWNFPGKKIANNNASALYIACCEGHADIVRILVHSKQFDVNQRNYKGYSPLYAACHKNYPDIVEMLLMDPRTDVNSCESPLDFSNEIKTLLVQHKSFAINRLYNYKYLRKTFLHDAILKRNTQMVKVILSHPNINPNVCDCDDNQPLLVASLEVQNKRKRRHNELFRPDAMFDAIINHPKTHGNARDRSGRTLFHKYIEYAKIYHGLIYHIYRLVIQWPDLRMNITDCFGQTSLMCCASAYHNNFLDNMNRKVAWIKSTLRCKLIPSRSNEFYNLYHAMQTDIKQKNWSDTPIHKILKDVTAMIRVIDKVCGPFDVIAHGSYINVKMDFYALFITEIVHTYEIIRQKNLPFDIFMEILKYYVEDFVLYNSR